MTEGGTYVCQWTWERGVSELRLVHDPSVRATGSNFDEVADELAGQIGDGEALLEFPSGRPGKDGPGVLSSWRSLGYHESVKATNRAATHFMDGLCQHCGFGIGRRTEQELTLNAAPRGDVVGVDGTLPWALLLSERFLDALTDDEKKEIRVQPTECPGSRRFFELVGDPVGHAVGMHGAEYQEAFHQSWACRLCHRRMITLEHSDYDSRAVFLRASDLPVRPPSAFVFNEGHRLGIAISGARWGDLSRLSGMRGASTSTLHVVTDTVSDPEPGLPDPDDFDWVL